MCQEQGSLACRSLDCPAEPQLFKEESERLMGHDSRIQFLSSFCCWRFPLKVLSNPLPTAVMSPNMSLFSVHAILILSTDDRSRILTKYYSAPHAPPNSTSQSGVNLYPTIKEQKTFEKGLLEKTNKQSSDIILYDGRVVVFKVEGDVMLYVVGGGEENEILLFGIVLALRDSLSILLKYVAAFHVSSILVRAANDCSIAGIRQTNAP